MITNNVNYRRSRQRERILAVLCGTKSHPTADWIYEQIKEEMPRLSLGTVYRNLRILEEQGLLVKLPLGSSFDRYDGNTEKHYHITCSECGCVDDVNIPVDSSINEQAEKISGYSSIIHRTDFSGICSLCSKKKSQQENHSTNG